MYTIETRGKDGDDNGKPKSEEWDSGTSVKHLFEKVVIASFLLFLIIKSISVIIQERG